jgi:hypothetical protein
MLAPSFSVVLRADAFDSDKLGVRRRSPEQPSAAAAASRYSRSEFPVVEPVRPTTVPAWSVSRHHEHRTRQALKNGVHIASDNVNFPIKSNFNRPAAAADPLHKEEAKARPKVEKTVNMTFNWLVGNSIPTAILSDEFTVAHAASLSANVVDTTNADDLLLSVFAKVIWQASAHHLKWFVEGCSSQRVIRHKLSFYLRCGLFSLFRDEEGKEAVQFPTVDVVRAVSKTLSADTRQDFAGNLLLDFFSARQVCSSGAQAPTITRRGFKPNLSLGKTLCRLALLFKKGSAFFLYSVEALGLLVDSGRPSTQ